ncbi:HAUS augmin-like complex subunit 1 [Hippocampus zosterae]|uniref:HAUS augmin-like complex subunit 1 n=1 Tax=Hippocampus zosterae TaxID=109293 RepID=UPI00223DE87D|nr:HAUS augmin-like complex subunit 1 [Hippocampus zosterae]
MCEKMQKVNRWLAAALGDEAVPQFEVTARTVDILEQLARSSESRCRHARLLAEDRRQKAAEYLADGAHLQDVLVQGLGMSFASLPKACVDYVSSLVDNSLVLAVRDTSLCSLMPALNRLTGELLEAEKSETQLDRELLNLRKKLSAALVLRGQLQADMSKTRQAQMVESAKAEEHLLNMDFVQAKAKEIQSRREAQEAQLASRNMKESLSHGALVGLSEEVNVLKKQIGSLKKNLEPFVDLSASPSLARVKIEEAKRELAALDSQLEMHVDFK